MRLRLPGGVSADDNAVQEDGQTPEEPWQSFKVFFSYLSFFLLFSFSLCLSFLSLYTAYNAAVKKDGQTLRGPVEVLKGILLILVFLSLIFCLSFVSFSPADDETLTLSFLLSLLLY